MKLKQHFGDRRDSHSNFLKRSLPVCLSLGLFFGLGILLMASSPPNTRKHVAQSAGFAEVTEDGITANDVLAGWCAYGSLTGTWTDEHWRVLDPACALRDLLGALQNHTQTAYNITASDQEQAGGQIGNEQKDSKVETPADAPDNRPTSNPNSNSNDHDGAASQGQTVTKNDAVTKELDMLASRDKASSVSVNTDITNETHMLPPPPPLDSSDADAAAEAAEVEAEAAEAAFQASSTARIMFLSDSVDRHILGYLCDALSGQGQLMNPDGTPHVHAPTAPPLGSSSPPTPSDAAPSTQPQQDEQQNGQQQQEQQQQQQQQEQEKVSDSQQGSDRQQQEQDNKSDSQQAASSDTDATAASTENQPRVITATNTTDNAQQQPGSDGGVQNDTVGVNSTSSSMNDSMHDSGTARRAGRSAFGAESNGRLGEMHINLNKHQASAAAQLNQLPGDNNLATDRKDSRTEHVNQQAASGWDELDVTEEEDDNGNGQTQKATGTASNARHLHSFKHKRHKHRKLHQEVGSANNEDKAEMAKTQPQFVFRLKDGVVVDGHNTDVTSNQNSASQGQGQPGDSQQPEPIHSRPVRQPSNDGGHAVSQDRPRFPWPVKVMRHMLPYVCNVAALPDLKLMSAYIPSVHPTGPYHRNTRKGWQQQLVDASNVWQTALSSTEAPDVVVLGSGMWDLARMSAHEPSLVSEPELPKRVMDTWVGNFTRLVTKVRAALPKTTMLVYHTTMMPSFDPHTGLFDKQHLGRRFYVSQMNAAGKQAAALMGLEVLDYAELVSRFMEGQTYLADAVHPGPGVSLEIANMLLNYVHQVRVRQRQDSHWQHPSMWLTRSGGGGGAAGGTAEEQQ